jgi:hypothetical protein
LDNDHTFEYYNITSSDSAVVCLCGGIKISVKLPCGEEIFFEVKLTDTIESLKRQFEEREGL